MTLPVAYRSEASCLADRRDIIAAGSGFGFDRVFAECSEQPRSNARQTSLRETPIA